MTTQADKFFLRIYDNFHPMDESEAYNSGQYDSYEDAVLAAREIVDSFLTHNLESGKTPDSLYAQFCLFGDDPVVLPDEPGETGRFSARTYAKTRTDEILGHEG